MMAGTRCVRVTVRSSVSVLTDAIIQAPSLVRWWQLARSLYSYVYALAKERKKVGWAAQQLFSSFFLFIIY